MNLLPKSGARPFLPAFLAALILLLLNSVLAFGQAAPEAKVPMSDEVFKNVQVLKGIPADEFLETMGIFSAALGVSCENCHKADDSSWDNYAQDNTPMKKTARRMVAIMAGVNKSYFGGRQVITCYSCHRGADHPKTTPDLDAIYGGMASEDLDDAIVQAKDVPSADQILDKYIEALGGAQKLNAITSIIGKGISSGYGPESGQRKYEIYLKAPGQRAQFIHTDNGDFATVTDGTQAWIAQPLRPIAVMPLSGGSLEGAKVDAEIAFAGHIKQSLTNWRSGAPSIVNDAKVNVVQGVTPGGTMVTFYFDPTTNLLVRMKRYANSPVGRLPVQYDFSDYRDVKGVKMPYKWNQLWLDQRENVELSDIQVNVPVEASRFNKPSAPVAPVAKR